MKTMNEKNIKLQGIIKERAADSLARASLNNYDIRNAYVTRTYDDLYRKIAALPDENPAPMIITKNLALTGLALGGLIAVPYIGIASSVFSGLAGYWFDYAMDESRASQVWTKVRAYSENLIEQKMSEDQFNRMVSQVEGLRATIRQYATFLQKNQKSEALAYCRNCITAFEQMMPSFKQVGIEVLSLPLYAQAAALHLLIYRDMIINGDNWGLSEADQNIYKRLFKEKLDAHRKYIKDTYLKGLEQRKTKAENLKNIFVPNAKDGLRPQGGILRAVTTVPDGISPEQESYGDTARWNYVNMYRTGMSQTVLAIASDFQHYDPQLYPRLYTGKDTTEIYTPISGMVPYRTKIEDIDNILEGQDNGSYKGNLLETIFGINDFEDYGQIGVTQQKLYNNDGISYLSWEGDVQNQTRYTKKSIFNNDAIAINQIYARHSGCPREIRMFYNSENRKPKGEGILTTTAPSRSVHATKADSLYFESITSDMFGYQLSSVRSIGFQKDAVVERGNLLPTDIMGMVFGFRYGNANYKHYLDLNKCYGVPAEMYSKAFNVGTIKELLNSCNSVKSSTTGTSYVEYEVYCPVNIGQYDLACKLAYKGNTNINLPVTCNDKNMGSILVNQTTGDPEAIIGDYGDYKIFKLFSGLELKRGKNTIKIGLPAEMALASVEITPTRAIQQISGETQNFGSIGFFMDNQSSTEPDIIKAVAENGTHGISNQPTRWNLCVGGNIVYQFTENTPTNNIMNAVNNLPIEQKRGDYFWISKEEGIVREKIVNPKDNSFIEFYQTEDHNFAWTGHPESTLGSDPSQQLYIYVGGELQNSFSYDWKLKYIVAAFNKANLKGVGIRIKNTPATLHERLIDMINNLFLRLPGTKNKPDYNRIRVDLSSYDIEQCRNTVSILGYELSNKTVKTYLDLIKIAENLLAKK
ncbi:hypothetical protein BHL53_14520 [Bacillus cereus]|uniref:insecticidal delta-endotoxin Cry8Ea1 family protein n=1 Tax=Bacillus cereus TaxID=1396 RepID=UPI0009C73812|nr:insecticidal delta-endotoxin Cry8Ea1 family protein [Bacillus cereus]OPA24175.1 hypothetical protein BHL53_14520 [Bacillus cereus]